MCRMYGCQKSIVMRVATHERVPTSIEDVLKANDVGLNVRVRIFDGVANASLCGEMHNTAEAMCFEERVHRTAIRDVEAFEAKAASRLESRESRILQIRVVVVVDVVDTDDFIAAVEQRMRDMRANKACTASDEDGRW